MKKKKSPALELVKIDSSAIGLMYHALMSISFLAPEGTQIRAVVDKALRRMNTEHIAEVQAVLGIR